MAASFTHAPRLVRERGSQLKPTDLCFAFRRFVRQHSEHRIERLQYRARLLLPERFLCGPRRIRGRLTIVARSGGTLNPKRRIVIKYSVLSRDPDGTFPQDL